VRHRILSILSTVALAVIFVSCSQLSSVKAAGLKPVSERKPAPDFELKDSMGRTFKLSDYKGKIVLLNFWATWCGPCKIEIPWFMEFEKQHKDKGFAVLGISMDEEGWEVVKPFLDSVKVNYRVAIGSDSVAALYGGVDSLPTSFILDQKGRIASVHVGLVSKSAYQNEIEQLLGIKKSSAAGSAVPAVVLGAK
jgi:peroxiredoxin